jgi:hypothetical protein
MTDKPMLKLDWCSYEAAKYAVEHWHYSKRMPKSKLNTIGVWEDSKYIGTIIFGYGATPELVNPYGLTMQQGCELVRVALTNHITPVSRILTIAIKFLKDKNPNLRIIVSFADPGEGHHGGIYQATNWLYCGLSEGCYHYKDKKGKIWHPRNVGENLSKSSICVKPSECIKVWKEGKHRYLYPLDNDMRKQIEPLRKPYPKRGAGEIDNASQTNEKTGGASPTAPLLYPQDT